MNVGNPSFSQYDVRPHVYYSVTWSEEAWIIVYSFYYARDWADEGIDCNEDEHEGDMVKVFVVVKRPDSANQSPEEMLLGFKTTTPDGLYSNSSTCPTETSAKVIKPFHNSTTALGAHPVIWSSSGSHHYYLSPTLAQWDEHTYGPCRVHGDTRIIYHPPADDSDITTALLEIDDQKEYYGLIDIFDVDEGLWVQRTNGALFNQEEPLHAQHFLCDDGDGCGINEGGLIDFGPDGTPWAPWTGSWGLNPLKEILINGFNDFDCECTNSINEGCGENTVLTSDAYVCNLYLCELYEIIMPEEFLCDGVLTKNPTESNNTVFVNFQLSAAGVFPNAEVTWCWELPSGFDNPVSCVGCSQTPVNNCVITGGDIVLKIENATLQQLWNNPEQFVVTASTNLSDCGEITKELPFKVQLLGLVSTDTADCEKMVFEVKQEWHIDGNVYSWDFPLYDALATVSSGGRRVEFSTESVIQQTSETTNPERKLDYSLTITNPSSEFEADVSGEREIPDCYYGGLGLMVYPNPATDNIYLEVEGVNPSEEALDIHIFDHQFNRVGRELYFLKGQTIDVSGLGNGLYFLCAVTKEGKMLTKKFCVGRH